jgi:hypothetical protein
VSTPNIFTTDPAIPVEVLCASSRCILLSLLDVKEREIVEAGVRSDSCGTGYPVHVIHVPNTRLEQGNSYCEGG